METTKRAPAWFSRLLDLALAEARDAVTGQITTLQEQIAAHEAQLATIATKHDYVQDLSGRFKTQLKAIAKRAANP